VVYDEVDEGVEVEDPFAAGAAGSGDDAAGSEDWQTDEDDAEGDGDEEDEDEAEEDEEEEE